MNSKLFYALISWFQQNKRDLPWRKDVDTYAIHVSEIMLQQTKVETVIPYYITFLNTLKNYEDLAQVEDRIFMKLWEGLGYYSRARNLKKAAQIIVENYQGVFPKDYKKAISLPGIGEYTAGAILSRAYHLPYAAVDGNVLRVLSRIEGSFKDIKAEKTKKEYKALLEKEIQHFSPGTFNEAFMDLGATICLPKQQPKCEICPISSFCKAFQEGKQNQYPVKIAKNEKIIEEKTCVFLSWNNRFFLIPKEQGLLKGLYAPILIDSFEREDELEEILKKQGIKIRYFQELPLKKHIFSHRIWLMKGYIVHILFNNNMKKEQFFSLDDLKEKIPVPTCFKKFFPYF